MKIVMCTLNAKFIHTNLAMRYIKAYSQPEFDILLKEYTLKDMTMNIVTDLYFHKPDVLLFSIYIWNVTSTFEIISLMKKLLPNVKIAVGGPEVSFDVRERLLENPGIDVISIGEGELTTKRLLTAWFKNTDLTDVPGIAFRKDGDIIVNGKSGHLDLSKIPTPYRFPEDIPHLPKRITYIETSRGCPFNCQFCLSSTEQGIRYFDVEWIKSELRFLMAQGARIIKFLDRTFNTNKEYALEIFQFLIDEHKPGCVFQFEITADIMPPEIIHFLNEHAPEGLFRFEIGVQSTNDLTNEIIHRRQDFEKLSHIVTLIKNGGKIEQHLDLIAGLPEENYLSFRKTFNDVFALRPEELQLGFLKMLRGTGLRIRASEHDYVFMDKPPYEVLGNNVLSFEDGIRLKQTEDVLEKYWNDHRMDRTIEYLIAHFFETPFDFFQDFGTFWEENNWSRIGHQLPDLFTRLYSFLENAAFQNLDVVLGLMKIDYLSQQKIKPKIWWEKNKTPFLIEEIIQSPLLFGQAFASLGLTLQDLHKHTIIEYIPFDYHSLINTGEIARQQGVLLTYFHPVTKNANLFYSPSHH